MEAKLKNTWKSRVFEKCTLVYESREKATSEPKFRISVRSYKFILIICTKMPTYFVPGFFLRLFVLFWLILFCFIAESLLCSVSMVLIFELIFNTAWIRQSRIEYFEVEQKDRGMENLFLPWSESGAFSFFHSKEDAKLARIMFVTCLFAWRVGWIIVLFCRHEMEEES